MTTGRRETHAGLCKAHRRDYLLGIPNPTSTLHDDGYDTQLTRSVFASARVTTTTATTTKTISTIAPTPLQDATAKSTLAWQGHLEALFHQAKNCFTDIVWALSTEVDAKPTGEQVYGHKAIVYARAVTGDDYRDLDSGYG